MTNYSNSQEALLTQGFTVIKEIYSIEELTQLADLIALADQSGSKFMKTDDLFAIRQFLKQVPDSFSVIFNDKLISTITGIFGDGFFVSKSIYFDKPQKSNWFVAPHRGLTISVDKKLSLPGFSNWTVKQNQFAVQPPLSILYNNFTIRIHLDNTDKDNGALKVISGSHKVSDLNETVMKHPIVCNVNAGDIMIMRPLLLHASDRTVSDKRRRVIHIEFSRSVLPDQISWSEKIAINKVNVL